MSRIIKFRIWDNLKKEWCNNQLIWRMRADINSYATIAPPGIYFAQHPDGLTYQQFTGLHDKNEREIYEGDIVKFRSYDDWTDQEGHIGLYPIIWREIEHIGYYSAGWSAGYHGSWPKEMEVVGNILENPELLK